MQEREKTSDGVFVAGFLGQETIKMKKLEENEWKDFSGI